MIDIDYTIFASNSFMLFFCCPVKATGGPVKLAARLLPPAKQGGVCRESKLRPEKANQHKKHKGQPKQELHGVNEEGFHGWG
jgi:hypothetical protein